MTHEEAAREALRARIIAVAGQQAIRFEELHPHIPDPTRPTFYRVWVGPPGNARMFGGTSLEQAGERAIDAFARGV